MSKINTAGQIRRFLIDTMEEIKAGKVEESVARNLIKMSAQINESIYSEAKIAKLKMDAGETMDKFGSLKLD